MGTSKGVCRIVYETDRHIGRQFGVFDVLVCFPLSMYLPMLGLAVRLQSSVQVCQPRMAIQKGKNAEGPATVDEKKKDEFLPRKTKGPADGDFRTPLFFF